MKRGYVEKPVEALVKGDRVVVAKRLYTVDDAPHSNPSGAFWHVSYEGNLLLDVPRGTVFLVKK